MITVSFKNIAPFILFLNFNLGIAESLRKLLTDPDLTVRQKATECLFVIGGEFYSGYQCPDYKV